MATYITSDLHFFHKNILKYNPDTRPWENVEEMNEGVINVWNSIVDKNDVVYHLGDFSFGNPAQTEDVLARLKGKIIFIEGNHDHALKRVRNTTPYLEMKHNGTHAVMCHYPLVLWNRSHHGSVMLFGHCHGSYEGNGRTMDVGWDANGRILLLDEAVEMCLNKPIHYVSHHGENRE